MTAARSYEAPFKFDGSASLASPLPDVEDSAWTLFVQLMADPETMFTVTAEGLLGMFHFHHTRLLRFEVRDLKTFLQTPDEQYRLFETSCKDFLPFMRKDARPPQMTLSGLLGVAHRAGLRSARRWVRNRDNDRQKHPFTTTVFNMTNGVF